MQGIITSINGPVVKCKNTEGFKLREMVLVGEKKLIGEIIEIDGEGAVLQVYEETEGLRLGEKVESTGEPLHATLGPGILGHIYDGILRPLDVIEKQYGSFIESGIGLVSIDKNKKWNLDYKVKVGDKVEPGMIYATVQETSLIEHRLLIPEGVSGVVTWTEDEPLTTEDVALKVSTEEGEKRVTVETHWPVRKPRPLKVRKGPIVPLVTGQRVIDTFFPIAKGASTAIPGGFGTGKTITQHQMAKWSDADIIVYIGCGERGNEMTDVLEEFQKLEDPRSGKKLIERTILIANTSNMPVAAREASIYTGITIAEYYRDMGYDVALMADSTSRWAEALRELSGRLEEIPAEEGYPAYLASRLAEFYERAGYGETMSGGLGSVTIIGAVSPAGGDFTEPVTENTKRYIQAFLALDKKLAYARHYPSIDWMTSYSKYVVTLQKWFEENVSPDMDDLRQLMLGVLFEENKLKDIVQLVGEDVLPDSQRLTLLVARIIRTGFLQQNAFHPIDSYVPLKKQFLMLETMALFLQRAKEVIAMQAPISVITETGLEEELIKMKYTIDNENLKAFDELKSKINHTFDNLAYRYRRIQ
ncbi:V-type ATP synthase subunit A [Guggenheimella bovis]